jgi:hypothetical protein
MAHADWIIDFWPGAGHDGGRIVFDGTPADLVAARSTLTGEHLAAFVGSRPKAVPSRWARRHASPSEPACPHPLAPERVGQGRDGSQGPHQIGTDAGRRTPARHHVGEVHDRGATMPSGRNTCKRRAQHAG